MNKNISAEENFRQAYVKLKNEGVELTFEAIAVEAGRSVGALKKKRYPELHKEIQEAMEKQQAFITKYKQRIEELEKAKSKIAEQRDNWKLMYENQSQQLVVLINKVHNVEN